MEVGDEVKWTHKKRISNGFSFENHTGRIVEFSNKLVVVNHNGRLVQLSKAEIRPVGGEG